MTSTDPAKALARNLSNLERRLNAVERGTQLAHSSLVVDGETVTVPQTVRTATTALQAANGKNKVVYSDSPPSGNGTAPGDIWFQMVDGVVTGNWEWTGEAWESRTFGDEVLSSLTVGKLVAGEIAAGQKIIAGPQFGTHAEMSSTGFRVYKDDPVDGIPNEVVRMGTNTSDFIGVVSSTGELLASIDETGQGNFQGLNIVGDPVIEGTPLSEKIGAIGGKTVGRWDGVINGLDGQSGLGIRSEYGVAQFTFPCVAGRTYMVQINGPFWYFHEAGANLGGGEASIVLRHEQDAAVTMSSEMLTSWGFSGSDNDMWQRPSLTYPWYANYTGTCNFGVLMNLSHPPNEQSVVRIPEGSLMSMAAFDMGPSGVATAGNQSGMGGGLYQGPPPPPPPPPTQQYYVDLAPVGKVSYRGDGSVRDDLGGLDVVQGWDPSGYNGDGSGQYWFWLPDITGTVDQVDLYFYTSHWYYNHGGTAVVNISDARGASNPYRFRGDNFHVGLPKPGGRWVQLPSDWWQFFRGSGNAAFDGRASSIVIGPGFGTNLEHYGRFTDCRLRIWYTQ